MFSRTSQARLKMVFEFKYYLIKARVRRSVLSDIKREAQPSVL